MNQSKHTPGPWNDFKINSFRETGEICPEIWNKHGRIAMVSIYADKEETIANARLIAAAPDLLEALKNLTQAVEDNLGPEPMQLRLHFARKAIAKAEGRE